MKLPSLPLFDDLPRSARAPLERAAVTRSLSAGELLFEEGAPSTELYVVASGSLSVEKQGPGARAPHFLHAIGPGDPIGEIALFDRKPRSAAVRATSPSVVVVLSNDVVIACTPLVARLGEQLAERLRRSSEGALDAAQQRAAMGTLIVKIITLLCGYALLLSALPGLDLGSTSTSYVSLPLVFAFGYGAIRFIRSTGYPLSTFGLGWRRLPMSVIEAIVLTPPFCAAITGLKWLAMKVHAPWRELSLFERTDWHARLTEPLVVKLLALYFVSSLVQELIVRSALQASLEEFLVGPNKRRTTLFVCALMFAVNHLHMSFAFAAFAFVPGLFWGYLFSRQRHLAGPVLSHFAVGAYVFFVLGVSLP
jgi:CRP-like cAMP-binding protein